MGNPNWIFSFIFLFSIAFATLIPNLTGDLRVFIGEIPNILNFIEKIVEELQSGQLPFIPEGVQDFLNLDDQIKNIGYDNSCSLNRASKDCLQILKRI